MIGNSISNEDKKYKLVDINEIETDSSPFIAALERCQNLSAKESWSCYPFKPECQVQFENSVAKAVESIAEDNPFFES